MDLAFDSRRDRHDAINPPPVSSLTEYTHNERKGQRYRTRTIIISSARQIFPQRNARVNIIYNRRTPPRCCPSLSRGRPPLDDSRGDFRIFFFLLLLDSSRRFASRLFDNHYRDKRILCACGPKSIRSMDSLLLDSSVLAYRSIRSTWIVIAKK